MSAPAAAGGSGCQYFVGDFDGTTFTSQDTASARQPPAGTVSCDLRRLYGDWTANGNAFGTAPATGNVPRQSPVTGQTGTGLVNTFLGGDTATGDLTSPEFTIDSPYLDFQVGGGKHPHVEGAVQRGLRPAGSLRRLRGPDLGRGLDRHRHFTGTRPRPAATWPVGATARKSSTPASAPTRHRHITSPAFTVRPTTSTS